MPQVLVIEDYEDNALLVDRVMTPRGYTVLHAPDGEIGLQMAEEHKPDLILLDLGLPGIDGPTVASQVRRIPGLAEIPIIAFTAWPEETARKMVEVYGCNGYIQKPVNINQLAQQIESFFRPS